jgi:hypothetical protein
MDQVRRYRPPPNFVKDTDNRTDGYRAQFGSDECWELDALSLAVIADLIEAELETLIVQSRWRKAMTVERRRRKQLDAVAANWTKVEKIFGWSKRRRQ